MQRIGPTRVIVAAGEGVARAGVVDTDHERLAPARAVRVLELVLLRRLHVRLELLALVLGRTKVLRRRSTRRGVLHGRRALGSSVVSDRGCRGRVSVDRFSLRVQGENETSDALLRVVRRLVLSRLLETLRLGEVELLAWRTRWRSVAGNQIVSGREVGPWRATSLTLRRRTAADNHLVAGTALGAGRHTLAGTALPAESDAVDLLRGTTFG